MASHQTSPESADSTPAPVGGTKGPPRKPSLLGKMANAVGVAALSAAAMLPVAATAAGCAPRERPEGPAAGPEEVTPIDNAIVYKVEGTSTPRKVESPSENEEVIAITVTNSSTDQPMHIKSISLKTAFTGRLESGMGLANSNAYNALREQSEVSLVDEGGQPVSPIRHKIGVNGYRYDEQVSFVAGPEGGSSKGGKYT